LIEMLLLFFFLCKLVCSKSLIMKKIYAISILFTLIFNLKGISQNTCATPYLFETGSTYSYAFTTNTTAQSGINYNCLGTQPNPIWFYFTVCTEGDIQFSINTSNTSSDLDYVMWGGLIDEYDCVLDTTLVVGCNYSPSPLTSIYIDSLQVGYYKFMITNYSNFVDTMTIQQSGGSAITCGGCLAITHQLCKVTTDVTLNKNVVNWVKEPSFVGEFRVQKETTTAGIYNTIGTVLSSDSTFFIDTLSNPIQQAYRYRLETLDTCGNLRYSNFHQTIHLQNATNPGTSNMELSWTPYIGISYSTYYIYRGSSPLNLTLYDSISSSFTTYTDVNPNPSELYYSVVVYLTTSCLYTGPLKLSIDTIKSNVSFETSVSIYENKVVDFNLYPNPTKDILNITFGAENITAKLDLMDIYGRIILTKNLINSNKYDIDVRDLPQGYYIISLNTAKGISRQTFIKTK